MIQPITGLFCIGAMLGVWGTDMRRTYLLVASQPLSAKCLWAGKGWL